MKVTLSICVVGALMVLTACSKTNNIAGVWRGKLESQRTGLAASVTLVLNPDSTATLTPYPPDEKSPGDGLVSLNDYYWDERSGFVFLQVSSKAVPQDPFLRIDMSTSERLTIRLEIVNGGKTLRWQTKVGDVLFERD